LCLEKNVLEEFPNLTQGLPDGAQLQTANIAGVFQELLMQGGAITRYWDALDNDVNFCHRQGWIHSDLDKKTDMVSYTFPSPLHATYVSWKLIPASEDCPFETVRDLAFAILMKFVPARQSSPSRIGVAFSDRPLEARYQCEFYRGLFSATGGSVRICPELLTAPGARSGRIEFFIPGKKWGIALTREGSKLAEHDSRFGVVGKYGVWLSSGDISDYIILDCRTSTPNLPHPGKTSHTSNYSRITKVFLQI
jgi:hypothetical protein